MSHYPASPYPRRTSLSNQQRFATKQYQSNQVQIDLLRGLTDHLKLSHELILQRFLRTRSKMTTNTETSGHDTPPSVTYGFIGIGVMGFGMAQNLRSKIPKNETLVLCEINQPRRDQFVTENPGPIKIANSPKEVAELAVSASIFSCRSNYSHFMTGYHNHYAP
jgi:hypothetical protein